MYRIYSAPIYNISQLRRDVTMVPGKCSIKSTCGSNPCITDSLQGLMRVIGLYGWVNTVLIRAYFSNLYLLVATPRVSGRSNRFTPRAWALQAGETCSGGDGCFYAKPLMQIRLGLRNEKHASPGRLRPRAVVPWTMMDLQVAHPCLIPDRSPGEGLSWR
ncbi:hypothetical protein K493DRAFT_54543 [Basidiobolus meristosporus CBS 931.73]|uniref:Uncharacterized protein n=1 Tax=Basidiobolus meristosporus CBS 931.73 TaxID=1314790 RepID=A0A1Y1Z277_9FUNG|nr:hypothetical protein K493DRAFT_54543 [Basidiobolus meristosporus CBS 931.73]|eukprot:ORY04401.1 hypothetical protein K493DRAFT_54543 [Basidiobolus meristosporus CBS 931.73]